MYSWNAFPIPYPHSFSTVYYYCFYVLPTPQCRMTYAPARSHHPNGSGSPLRLGVPLGPRSGSPCLHVSSRGPIGKSRATPAEASFSALRIGLWVAVRPIIYGWETRVFPQKASRSSPVYPRAAASPPLPSALTWTGASEKVCLGPKR